MLAAQSLDQNSARKKPRVGVLLGGLSAEREISLQTGNGVVQALREGGFEVVAIDVNERACEQIAAARIDVAFIALHGRFGEDGCMQGLLELMRVPYTGSGVLASALAMDKVLSKQVFAAVGIPSARSVYPATAASVATLGAPVVIKPRAEGSSVGLEIVRSSADLPAALQRLAKASQPMMAEAYIEGREFSVAVIGRAEAARALGAVEIRPKLGVYDYQAKYQRNDTTYIVPPELPVAVSEQLHQRAVACHRALDCSGATRVDFRWDETQPDGPLVLEVNTLPGLTSHSLVPKIAAHAGYTYRQLVEWIVADAGLKA